MIRHEKINIYSAMAAASVILAVVTGCLANNAAVSKAAGTAGKAGSNRMGNNDGRLHDAAETANDINIEKSTDGSRKRMLHDRIYRQFALYGRDDSKKTDT